MSTSESQSGLVLALAEEFLERYRRGERPSLKEYIDRHPELAGEIREVFPAMAMMENIALADDSLAPTGAGAGPAARPPRLNQLGEFRILREVGRGGMGVVYEAEQVSLGRLVALKVLPGSMLRDPKRRSRFEREARSAARLHHTNIVPVFGVGEHDGTPFYVMQFIQGLGLDAVLEELRALRDRPARGRADEADGEAAGDGEGNHHANANAYGNGEFGDEVTHAASMSRPGVSVVAVTRSLLTGRFEAASESTGVDPHRPTVGATADHTPLPTETGAPAGGSDGSGRPVDPSSLESVSWLGSGPQSSGDSRSRPSRRWTYWQGVARIGAQVAEALEYAHKQGVVHRDVKPSNLLLDTRGTVWVTDFGLAKASDQQDLTHTGDLLGTLRYMPPEAFEGRSDHRGDIYALGLTLYELVALRPAFGEKDRGRLVRQVTTEEAPRLGAVNREVPRDLETIVHKAIDRDPAHRYQTAGELAADLQRFLDDQPILARRASLPERYARWARHHPGIAILGGVLTAVLVAAVIVSLVAASRFRAQAMRESLLARERESRRIEAEAARGEAERARRHAETVLVDMHAGRGLVAAERGESARAMLWFAQAAALAQHDSLREQANRIRARAWEREAVLPVLALEHPGQHVSHVLYQPGGSHLLTLTDDGQARLWHMPDGVPRRVPGGDRTVTAAAWSPDGARLALGRAGGEITVTRLADGERLLAVEFTVKVTALAFSPDGSRLAGGGGGAMARVWDAATGEVIGTAMPHPSVITHLAFSPRGDFLLTSDSTLTTRLYDVPSTTGQPRLNVRYPDKSKGFEPRFSARGDAVLTFTRYNELAWFDAATGQSTSPGVVALKLYNPRAVAVSPDGRWFAAGGYFGPQLFPVDPSAGASRLLGHTNEVTSCQFSSDSKLLLSSSWDRTVRLWSVPEGSPVGAPLPHEQGVEGAQFAPDGRHVLTWQFGGLVRLWRMPEPTGLVAVPDPFPAAARLRPSRDGRRAIAARWHNPYAQLQAWDAPMRVYDLATARAVGPAVVLTDAVVDAALDATGQRAAAVTTGPGGSFLHAWNVATGQALFPAQRLGSDPPASVDFSPDGEQVAAMVITSQFFLFDARDGRRLHGSRKFVSLTDLFAQIRFASSDALVIHHAGALYVFETKTRTWRLPHIRTAQAGVRSSAVAISDDGRHAATGSAPALGVSSFAVRVWDLATGTAASPAMALPDIPFVMAFTPDGRRLVTGSRDGQVYVWDWKTGRLAAPPCKADDEIYDLALLPGGRFALAAVRNGGGLGPGRVEAWDLITGRRIRPDQPLGPHSVQSVAVSADGGHALAAAQKGGLFALDLTDLVDSDTRPTDELVRLGELASGWRILDGDLVGLTAEEWLSLYRGARPRFQQPLAAMPVAAAPAAVVVHAPPVRMATADLGWRPLAREALARQRGRPADSYLGLRAAVYALLDGTGYTESCGLMLRYVGYDDPLAGERLARVCLLGRESLPAATRMAERAGQQLDADGNGWGAAVLSLSALRHGRPAVARRWAVRAQQLFGTRSAGARSFALTLRALADHGLGRDDDGREALRQARAGFGGDVTEFLHRASDPSPRPATDSPLQQVDLLCAAILYREAEALVLYDPIFPADPFAR